MIGHLLLTLFRVILFIISIFITVFFLIPSTGTVAEGSVSRHLLLGHGRSTKQFLPHLLSEQFFVHSEFLFLGQMLRDLRP